MVKSLTKPPIQLLKMINAIWLSVVQLADAILDDMVRVHAAVIEIADHPADCYGFHSRTRALFDHCEDLVELETHDGIAVGTADGGLVCVCLLAKGLYEGVQIAEESESAFGDSVYSFISFFSLLRVKGGGHSPPTVAGIQVPSRSTSTPVSRTSSRVAYLNISP